MSKRSTKWITYLSCIIYLTKLNYFFDHKTSFDTIVMNNIGTTIVNDK